MKDFAVNAKVPGKDGAPDQEATITVKAPETAKEAIEMFGDEAVNSNALANWKVTLQGTIRGAIKRGETQEQIQARLGSARMGVAVTKGAADPKQSFLAMFQAASPEEKKKLLKELQAAAAA